MEMMAYITLRPWSTMECSQPATWTTNRSLHMCQLTHPPSTRSSSASEGYLQASVVTQ